MDPHSGTSTQEKLPQTIDQLEEAPNPPGSQMKANDLEQSVSSEADEDHVTPKTWLVVFVRTPFLSHLAPPCVG
jgi:hypothetical protein